MNTLQLRTLRAVCVTAVLASLTATLAAQEIPAPRSTSDASRFAVVIEGGTAGIGPSLIITTSEKVSFTVGYTWLDHNYDSESDDADYDGKLKLSNFKAVANWHPWSSSFHFSGGAFVSDNHIEFNARPKNGTTYRLNGTTYNNTQISSIRGETDFENDIAPYFGVGWAKSPANSGWAFYADLGVIFAGSTNAKLSATGSLANDPTFQNNLRAEERELNDDLDSLSIYPVLQIGVMYRF